MTKNTNRVYKNYKIRKFSFMKCLKWLYHWITCLITFDHGPLIIRNCYYLSRTLYFTTKNHLHEHTVSAKSQKHTKYLVKIRVQVLHYKQQTFKMFGSCHGPLSDLIQPPRSIQVQLPPRNSGSSLKNHADSQNFQITIQTDW